MNRFYRIVLLSAMVALAGKAAIAQITLTKTDVENGFINAVRTEYGHEYNYGAFPSFNLGNSSSSSQSIDLSAAPAGDLSRDTMSVTYEPAAGLPGASEFPGATLGWSYELAPIPGASFLIATFYLLQNDGLYELGTYSRQYYPPYIDTTSVSKYQPKRLVFPLPMTYGTTRTATDTLVDAASGEYEVTTRSFVCNGFGSITFPSSAALPLLLKGAGSELALRVQTDDVIRVYNASHEQIGYAHNREIDFAGASTTIATFSVDDTNYVSGSASLTSRDVSIKSGTTGVTPLPTGIPENFSLSQNYPNPFNPSTKVTFAIPTTEQVTLKVYDILGREVATIVNAEMGAGSYTVDFNAENLAGGLYLCRLTAGTMSATMKMSLVK